MASGTQSSEITRTNELVRGGRGLSRENGRRTKNCGEKIWALFHHESLCEPHIGRDISRAGPPMRGDCPLSRELDASKIDMTAGVTVMAITAQRHPE